MSLFDSLSEKMANLDKKTKTNQEILKLERKRNEIIKEQDDNFKELGKTIYENYRDVIPLDLFDITTAIQAADSNIVMLDKSLDTLKGIIRCPNCNSEVPNTSNFCLYCGAQIATCEEEKVMDTIE